MPDQIPHDIREHTALRLPNHRSMSGDFTTSVDVFCGLAVGIRQTLPPQKAVPQRAQRGPALQVRPDRSPAYIWLSARSTRARIFSFPKTSSK